MKFPQVKERARTRARATKLLSTPRGTPGQRDERRAGPGTSARARRAAFGSAPRTAPHSEHNGRGCAPPPRPALGPCHSSCLPRPGPIPHGGAGAAVADTSGAPPAPPPQDPPPGPARPSPHRPGQQWDEAAGSGQHRPPPRPAPGPAPAPCW